MLSWIKDTIKGVKGEQDCIFCQIRDNPANAKLNKDQHFLYEDELFYVVNDISKASAREHILVMTKKHYRSGWDVPELGYFDKMKEIGGKVLRQLQQKNWGLKMQEGKQSTHTNNVKTEEKDISKNQFQPQNIQTNKRFGFHLPPYNSIDHIHLHGFLLPFSQFRYDKFHYGWMMTSIQEMKILYEKKKKVNK